MNQTMVKWAILAGAATAAVSAQAAGLSVRLELASPVLKGDVDVHVTLTLTNTSRTPLFLPKTQLPGAVHEAALFRITRDGEPVAYQGRLVKRSAASEREVVRLAPGASMSFQVELTGGYDLSQNGRYAIEYVGLSKQQSGLTPLLAPEAGSGPVYLWLEGRTPQAQPQEVQAPSLAASITYTGNCTASQKSSLASAVSAATNYSQSSYNYLNGTPSGTTRYKTWFGAFSTTGWNTAKSHFSKTLDAFKNKPLTLDCSCKDSYYAYVYPNQPYKIYVCNAFWSAPMTGTDSKAGTLVHEMTHFNVVAGTDDWAYGHSAAKSLALSNPSKALDNADSHEYFAENSPPLP